MILKHFVLMYIQKQAINKPSLDLKSKLTYLQMYTLAVLPQPVHFRDSFGKLTGEARKITLNIN